MNINVKQFIILIVMLLDVPVFGIAGEYSDAEPFVSFEEEPGLFCLANQSGIAPILIDSTDFKGLETVIAWYCNDLKMVCGQSPEILKSVLLQAKQVVIVGTLGKNKWIDQLVVKKKLDVSEIKEGWEKTLTTVVENPFSGIEKALVIAGSDKRGTFYGLLELSRQAGVSPWYWWADVPVDQHEEIYIKQGPFISEGPKVKYRGIFLNDEEPALGGWVREKFGGFNHDFYTHVFELILRSRGNFMWPAMWGKAFYDDDPENGKLADELGIVMGTSHHEPMGRAQEEWHRYGSGSWDYTKNKAVLDDFWAKGMERNKNYETLVTVGMRGDGDEAMTEGTNIKLLEEIVADQRKIISKVTGEKAKEIPQVWALYKEVQDYYDKGMRVPDDVTLLLCDDNWGNVRKLPDVNAPVHKGGYGMYYHVDYVGGPRNYKWINVSQIQRIWEQMNLTYSHGVDRLWVLNVGDLKPMEFPISFFLDMAWDPTKFNPGNLFDYTVNWCEEQFGGDYANEAARILNQYTKYNHRVTPELLNDRTFSLDNYDEFEHVYNDYRNLALDALRLYNLIPNEYKDAFDQLVLYPTNASANLYEMYYAVAKNRKLSAENNPEANYWADVVKRCYNRDSLLTDHYNHQISGGKWNHTMDQIHIGYTYWQEPRHRRMPEVHYVKKDEVAASELAFQEKDGYVSIEAENFATANGSEKIHWEVIPDLGKTVSGVTTFPQNEYPELNDSVFLEYNINFESSGEVSVYVLASPTLGYNQNKGLRYAISFDNEKEQVVNINTSVRPWETDRWRAERINRTKTQHEIEKSGLHKLRIRMLEPGIVLQKILVDAGGMKSSYLGPLQSEQITIEKEQK